MQGALRRWTLRVPVRDYVERIIATFGYEEPILDCCAGWEPNLYQPLFPNRQYVKLDYQDYSPSCIDVVCNIWDQPIKDESIGLVLNLESLEHIAFPQKAVDEIFRVLRPSGLLILSTVMQWRIHRFPRDYWRYCPDGLGVLLAKFTILDLTLEGDPTFPRGLWVTARKDLQGGTHEALRNPNFVPIVDDASLLVRLLKRVSRVIGYEVLKYNRP
jgi:SAM-dependent methyltransferase